jgi:hypothetical protein
LLGNLIGYNKAIKDFKEIYFGAKKENDTDWLYAQAKNLFRVSSF